MLVVAGLFSGCGYSPEEQPRSSEEPTPGAEAVLGTQQDSLYVLSTKLWRTRTIPVCWDNPDYSTTPEGTAQATARAWVRSAVEDSWGRYADLTFTGWGQCNGLVGGIKIKIEDSSSYPPRTDGLGTDLDPFWSRMYLNFTYVNWATDPCAKNLESCTKEIAVHEFGHAIGFAHEHLRPDNVNTDGTLKCNKSQTVGGDVNGDTTVGAYDIESVMSYCNKRYPYGFGKLTAMDIQGVQKIYGAKPGSIVGIDGMYLDVAGGSTSNWSRTELREGTPSKASQKWARQTNDALKNTNSGRCLDTYYGGSANGTDTQIYDCNGGIGGQKWSFAGVAISGFNGKCLDIVNGGTASGTRVQLWECNGSNAQKWTLTTSGDIRNPSSGKCLDVTGGNSANNTNLQIWDCNGSAAQKWTLESGGRVRGLASKCMDAYNSSGGNGTNVVLYDCNGQTNQRWHLSGPIVVGTGRCLDARGGAATPGTQTQIWDCNGTRAQVWNYFP